MPGSRYFTFHLISRGIFELKVFKRLHYGDAKIRRFFQQQLGSKIYVILLLSLFVAIAFMAKALLLFMTTGYSAYLTYLMERKLKNHLLKHYSSMDLGYFISKNSGHFMNVLTSQVGEVLTFFTNYSVLLTKVITTIIYTIVAFTIAWVFGLMAVVSACLLILLFKRLNQHASGLSRKLSSEGPVQNKYFLQFFQGYKYLFSTGQVEQITRKVAHSINALAKYKLKQDIAIAFTQSIREPIAVVLMISIICSDSCSISTCLSNYCIYRPIPLWFSKHTGSIGNLAKSINPIWKYRNGSQGNTEPKFEQGNWRVDKC